MIKIRRTQIGLFLKRCQMSKGDEWGRLLYVDRCILSLVCLHHFPVFSRTWLFTISTFHLPVKAWACTMPDRAQATTAPPHTATNHFLMMSGVYSRGGAAQGVIFKSNQISGKLDLIPPPWDPSWRTRPGLVQLTVINGRTFFSFRMSIYKSSSWTSGGKLSWNILHH